MWYAVTLTVPSPHVELVQQCLWESKTLGVVEEKENPAEQTVTLKAYFAASLITKTELTSQLTYLLSRYGVLFPFDIISLAFNDWGNSWKEHFKPFYLTEGLLICPSWDTSPVGPIKIILDPGMAFGTGHHATTALCAKLLLDHLRHPSPLVGEGKGEGNKMGLNVLDLGTGTGLLAIIAHKAGAINSPSPPTNDLTPLLSPLNLRGESKGGYIIGGQRGSYVATCVHVTAVDIDPEAIAAAKENFEKNDCTNDIEILDKIERVSGPFDLIVANILSSTLLQLKEEIRRLTKPLGKLILSGILADEANEVVSAYEKMGYALTKREQKEEWVALCLNSTSDEKK